MRLEKTTSRGPPCKAPHLCPECTLLCLSQPGLAAVVGVAVGVQLYRPRMFRRYKCTHKLSVRIREQRFFKGLGSDGV